MKILKHLKILLNSQHGGNCCFPICSLCAPSCKFPTPILTKENKTISPHPHTYVLEDTLCMHVPLCV